MTERHFGEETLASREERFSIEETSPIGVVSLRKIDRPRETSEKELEYILIMSSRIKERIGMVNSSEKKTG